MKIYLAGLVLLLSLFFVSTSCQKQAEEPKKEKETEVKFKPAPFFESNFISYVNDRYGEEVEKVEANNVTGTVVLTDKNFPESEFQGKVKEYLIKTPAEFFLLVNGLWTLDLTVKSEGAQFQLKINRDEYENYFGIKIDNLVDGAKLSEFTSRQFSPDAIKNYLTKFAMVSEIPTS